MEISVQKKRKDKQKNRTNTHKEEETQREVAESQSREALQRDAYQEFISNIASDRPITSNSDVILWPTLSDSLLEKSDFDSLTFTQREEIKPNTDQIAPIKVEAIKEEELEQIASLALSDKHAETYHKFKSYVDRVKDDPFYKRVLEYKECFFNSQLMTIKLEILKDSCREIVEKCWSLVSKQARFDQECGDGKLLTCYTTIDCAVFNQDKADEFMLINNQVLDLTKELQFNEYLLNVSKLYIQNYLDLFLQDFLNILLSFTSLREKYNGWDKFQMIVAIFFDFLRLENNDKELSQENTFIKDCRLWLTHIISCLMGSFSYCDSRIILLHIMRTRGIGSWGLMYIQWSESYDWEEEMLEHYLISWSCVLSPIEELELRIKSKLESIAYLEEQLQKLESEDWIVVNDHDLPMEEALKRSNSRLDLRSIMLLESDYLGLFSQFKLKQVFEELSFSYTRNKEKSPLKLISIAHHICLILIRGIHIMPKDYQEVIQHLGDHILFVSNCLGDTLDKDIQNVELQLLVSGDLQSTGAIEFDAFIGRIFLRLTSIKRKPIWAAISLLPYQYCTVTGKMRLSETLNTFLKFDRHPLESEIPFICDTVKKLALCDSRPNPHSIDSKFMEWEGIIAKLLQTIFKATFFKKGNSVSLDVFGQNCIYDVVTRKTDLLSNLLHWIRDDVEQLVEPDIISLVSKLPWSQFRATNSDFLILQNMLRDPENTLKAQIAMLVLDQINWGYSSEGHGIVFIPKYLHREMALMVSNLYLDRLAHFERDYIVASVTSAVEKTVQSSFVKNWNPVLKFNNWIWDFLYKLKLYQKPSTTDVYPVDSISGITRPFLALESTALLSLRSTMHSEAISAYILLMISEIGHHYHQFKLHSLSLMTVLANNGKLEAILLVLCYVLPSFSLDSDFLADHRFTQITKKLICGNLPPETFSNLKEIFSDYVGLLKYTQRDEILFAVDIWHKIILRLPNYGNFGSFLLGIVSHMCFEAGLSFECQESISSIFKEKLNEYQSSLGRISVSNPVISINSIMSYLTRKYPEILPAGGNQGFATNYWEWFVLDGYLAEVRATRKDRHDIGAKLLENGASDTITSHPLKMFTIYRLAKQISELSANHILAPIYLTLFFSLYFECLHGSTQIFGYHLLADSKDKCKERVKVFIRNSVRKLEGEDPEKFKILKNAYNAFSLWLEDQALLNDGLHTSSISMNYDIERLRECMEGHILKSGISSWNQFCQLVARRSETLSIPLDTFEDILKIGRQFHSLPAPKSMPVIPLRSPLVPQKNMDIDAIHSVVADVLNILTSKANQYQAIIQNLHKSDLDYVEYLKLLYTSSSIRNRTQKTCGKDCMSPAIFDYITYKIISVSEIRIILLDNRSTKDSYINIELVDSKTCLLALEINSILEYLNSRLQISDSSTKIGSQIFFEILESIKENQNLTNYAVSRFILKSMISGFGKSFISGSNDETVKLWTMMIFPNIIELSIDIFHPASAPEYFNLFYLDLYSRFEIFGDSFSSQIIRRFDITKWLEEDISEEKLFEFFKSIIYWPVPVEICPKTFTANRMLLSDIFSKPKFRKMIPDAISICFSKVISEKLFFIILSDVSSFLFTMVPESWKIGLSSLDLIEASFQREELVALLKVLDTEMTEDIKSRKQSLINARGNIQNSILQLLALIFSADQIYSMMINLHFEELYSILLSIYMACIGIVQIDRTWILGGSWQEDNSDSAKYVLRTLNSILEKLCRNASRTANISRFHWQVATIMIDIDVPQDMLLCFVLAIEDSPSWGLFALTNTEIAQLRCWMSESKISIPLIKLTLVIFKDCTILEPADYVNKLSQFENYFMDLILVMVYIINQSPSVSPDMNDRAPIYQSILSKMANISCRTMIKSSELDKVVDHINLLVWNTSSSQILEWEQSADPLVFTIKLLEIVASVRLDHPRVDLFPSYKRFIISLFSKHIFSHDSSFSDDDFSSIVFQFLKYGEELRESGRFKIMDLGFFGLTDVIGIFNRMSKNHALYASFWDGCLKASSESNIPLEYLLCSCVGFSSVECMSIFNEKCIDRFVELQNGPVDWNYVATFLIVPQLSIEHYVKCCLDNALLLQLFVYSLQELKTCSQVESKILIGEQIASWLNTFKTENLSLRKEGKVAPLLYVFSVMLSLELTQQSVLAHARLQSLVPNIANFLIKLSEDRVSGGLWSTLGFGPKSKYSVEFRFFCKVVGAFMASRVLPSQERSKIIESVESIHSNNEYEPLLLYLDPVMDDYLLADENLSVLPNLVSHETMALFSSFYVSNLEI